MIESPKQKQKSEEIMKNDSDRFFFIITLTKF